MAKKSKKKVKNSKLRKDVFGYFICPKCGFIKRNPIYNMHGYPMGFCDKSGEVKFPYKCIHDEEEMQLVDKSLLPVSMLLNKLEIGYINYISPVIEKDIIVNPYIAIKAERSPKGEENLEELENKLTLSHWKIDKGEYQFKDTTIEYLDNNENGSLINKPVKKTEITKFNKLILKLDDEKNTSTKYKKIFEKNLKFLTKTLQKIYEEV